MKYAKPEALLVGSSIAAVQNTAQTKTEMRYLDTVDLPQQNQINSFPMPAYETDD